MMPRKIGCALHFLRSRTAVEKGYTQVFVSVNKQLYRVVMFCFILQPKCPKCLSASKWPTPPAHQEHDNSVGNSLTQRQIGKTFYRMSLATMLLTLSPSCCLSEMDVDRLCYLIPPLGVLIVKWMF